MANNLEPPNTSSTRAFADRMTRPPSDLARMLHRQTKRALTDADFLPPIPFQFRHRQKGVFLYTVFILFCNLAIPCVLYYVLINHADLSPNALLGVAAASLGISSCFDHPFRMYKLFRHRQYYGPLNDDNIWHFDFLNHVYTISLIIFAFPLAIATSTRPVMEVFFLMSTPMLVGPVGVMLALTLLPIKVPWWMSSDPPGTRLKPGMFYIIEDVGAVDFRHGRIFRAAMHRRYTASPLFRQFWWMLTISWAGACILYIPLVLAVALTTTFDFAYGFVLGFFFIYLVVLILFSWGLLSLYLSKEWSWLQQRKADAAAEGLDVDPNSDMSPPNMRMADLVRHASLPHGPAYLAEEVEPPEPAHHRARSAGAAGATL